MRILLHTIITGYGNQDGAALRHVGQTWVGRFCLFSILCSLPYDVRGSVAVLYLYRVLGTDKRPINIVCLVLRAVLRANSYRLAEVACKSPESW